MSDPRFEVLRANMLTELRAVLEILREGKQPDAWKVGYVEATIEYVIEEMESHQ